MEVKSAKTSQQLETIVDKVSEAKKAQFNPIMSCSKKIIL